MNALGTVPGNNDLINVLKLQLIMAMMAVGCYF